MKLIEAMKRLWVIEKRMDSNCTSITEYASLLSTERPKFESEIVQRKEVESLVQANKDLTTEYLKLKRAIEQTNLGTEVEMDGAKYSIADLLVVKRKLAQSMMKTYESLNDSGARMRQVRILVGEKGERPQVMQLFDEKIKNENLRKWQDLHDNIDSRLEVINATSDLKE